MIEKKALKKNILVTGGTSGLGLELVHLFLGMGYNVVATGTREHHPDGKTERLTYYRVDFSDLNDTAVKFREIISKHIFDIVINNAGILSPAKKKITKDNHEYTFQVNFLAHYLLSIMILRNQQSVRDLCMVTITSPVYKLASPEISEPLSYNGLKAYSRSKLFQALMCVHFRELYGKGRNVFISFDPGTFGSGIYRMRGSFFSFLYKVAFPFMRSSGKIAKVLAEIIDRDEIITGSIYTYSRRIKPIPVPDKEDEEAFWQACRKMISQFL